MEEVLVGAISAITVAVFGAGGVGIWAKKRNGNNGNGGGEQIRLMRSIDKTLQEMHTNQETVKEKLGSIDTNIDGLMIGLARVEGRLSQ